MKKISLIASIALMVCAASQSWAGDITENSVSQLMTLSGVNKEVSHYPEFINMGLEQARLQAKAQQQKSPISDAEFTQMKSAMTAAFQPADILHAIGGEVKNGVSEADAKTILEWYQSELGRKITKAEDDAANPAAYQKMAQSAQSLMADEKRVDFAKRMDKLLKVTDKMMQLQENLAVAMFVAFSTASNQPANAAEFKAKISPMVQQQRANFEQAMILSNVYTYRDLDMASLEKYMAFLEGAETMRFNESVHKGMAAGLDQSVTKVGKALASLAKKHPTKTSKS